jgi:hypothetical protein
VVCHRLIEESVGCIVSMELAEVVYAFTTIGPNALDLMSVDVCGESRSNQ